MELLSALEGREFNKMKLALFLGLGLFPSDSTPDGATNVWEWEDGIGMQWETGIFIPTE